MVHFREIDEENFEAVVRMERPAGEGFVAANAYSLAQAWLYRENNDVFPYAIYEDDTPVGFLLLEEDGDELILWRIMFPEEHAGRGLGTRAVRLVLERARAAGKYRAVLLDCDPANARARRVYEKCGFVPTGKWNHGSEEMCREL